MDNEHHGMVIGGHDIVKYIPNLHSSEGETSEDESDFESQPLETSSTSGQESNSSDEIIHHRRRYQNRCRTPSSSDESTMSREVPDWFQDKPFLYSGRISVLAIPGMLLVLLFSGDMLLFIVTIGSLLVYLLYSSGNKQKALLAYLLTFIALQLTVVYSVIPLLWKSILNMIVILALNIYTFMTGGWILLLFEGFRFRDVDLLVLIEAGLFSLYPVIFVVLITWSVAVMTSVAVAPYVFMLVGFVVLQVFLMPTTSSFVKPHPQGNIAVWDLPSGYILDANAVAALAMMYVFGSSSLMVAIRLMNGWHIVFTLASLVQVLFITSCSIFLATFLNLRLFLEAHGIPHKHLLILRWSASVVSVVLVVPLLSCFDIHSHLLPWIPPILAVYISAVVCHFQRNKVAVQVSLLILLLGFFLIFSQLPWTLDYYIANESSSISWLQFILVFNAGLCVLVIYCAIYWTNDALGLCLVIQSLCYIYGAKILLVSELMSFALLLVLVILFTYLSIRLFHSNKLSWQHSLLISSLHLTALTTNLSHFYQKHAIIGSNKQDTIVSGGPWEIYEFISTFFLLAALLQVLIFEQQTYLEQQNILRFLCVLIFVLICNGPSFLKNLLTILSGNSQQPFSAYLGLISLVVISVYLKLACFNSTMSLRSRCYLVTVLVLPVLILALQPALSLESEELQKWSAIVGLSCILVAIPLASIYRNSLHIVGSCLGLPLGFCCLHLLFPSHSSLLIRLILGLKVMFSVIFLLIAWQNPRHSEKWIKALGLLIGMTSAVTILLENIVVVHWQSSLGLTSSIVALLLVSLVIKVRNSDYEQDQLDGLSERDRHIFGLSFFGNVSAIAAFLLFVIHWRKAEFWYIWVCLFSTSLLLLNKDKLLLAILTSANRIAPVAVAVTFTLCVATLCDCRFFLGLTTFARFVGFLELVALICTVPVMLNLWTVCCCGRHWWYDRLVVFLTPLYLLFFFFGSSYASWTLAIVGMVSGGWLMKYKLPLEIDYR